MRERLMELARRQRRQSHVAARPTRQPIPRHPRKPCGGCGDQRTAELVRAARARGNSQDEILRLLREARVTEAARQRPQESFSASPSGPPFLSRRHRLAGDLSTEA